MRDKRIEITGDFFDRYKLPISLIIEIVKYHFRYDTAYMSDILYNEFKLNLEDYKID